MAVYNKANNFTQDIVNGYHNFTTNTYKIFLSNQQPSGANTSKNSVSEISNAGGYTTGGNTVAMTVATAAGTVKVTGAQVSFTSNGTMGPFEWALLYNYSAAGNNLVGWWDYGSPVTLNSGESLTVALDQANGIFTIT